MKSQIEDDEVIQGLTTGTPNTTKGVAQRVDVETTGRQEENLCVSSQECLEVEHLGNPSSWRQHSSVKNQRVGERGKGVDRTPVIVILIHS